MQMMIENEKALELFSDNTVATTTEGPVVLDMLDLFDGLSVCARDYLAKYDSASLLLAARRGQLRTELKKDAGLEEGVEPKFGMDFVRGSVCNTCADELYKVFDREGMIRHDFREYANSFNILAFLQLTSNGIVEPDESYFNSMQNVKRILQLMTNSEYEEFVGLQPEVIDGFLSILKWNLSRNHYEIITSRMGLITGRCQSRAKVANKLRLTEQAVLFGEREVFLKMSRIFSMRDRTSLISLVNREPKKIRKRGSVS